MTATARARPVFVHCFLACEICGRPSPGVRRVGVATVPRRRLMSSAMGAGWTILKTGEARCPHHRNPLLEPTAWTPAK